VLSAGVLLEELQRFGDPGAAVFDSWPASKVDARRKWAHAFFVYARDMVDTAPVLTPTGETLVFADVEDAFFDSITLDFALVPAAATDFADAWRAAIVALGTGAPATSGGDSFTFQEMDPGDVGARYDALHADLVAALTTPLASRRADLEEIANAFHRATLGLKSTPTDIVVTYG
jgi:hypothetical protein